MDSGVHFGSMLAPKDRQWRVNKGSLFRILSWGVPGPHFERFWEVFERVWGRFFGRMLYDVRSCLQRLSTQKYLIWVLFFFVVLSVSFRFSFVLVPIVAKYTFKPTLPVPLLWQVYDFRCFSCFFRCCLFDSFSDGFWMLKWSQNGPKIIEKSINIRVWFSLSFFHGFSMDFRGPGPHKTMHFAWDILQKSRKSHVRKSDRNNSRKYTTNEA